MSGKKIDFKSLELLARGNQWHELEKLIQTTDRKLFLKNEILQLAILARRAYRLSFASYLLKPLVLDPEHNIRPDATVEAISEYAVVQTMLGGRKKALTLLNSVPEQSPAAHFAWVTYHFSRHQYAEAIPYLRDSIANESDRYKQQVAQLNLTACLVECEQFAEADQALERLEQFFSKESYKLLLANTKELRGQWYIHNQQWPEAEKTLREAQQLMVNENRLYSLFIEKWSLVCKIQRNQAEKQEILKFIKHAQSMDHHHSVREILFYWGLLKNDYQLLEKVHFATPYLSYRSKIVQRSGVQFSSPICPWNGDFFNHQYSKLLKLQQSPYKNVRFSSQEFTLFQALSRNIIEPFSVSSLFYEIYPDEYFDVEYSPAKTYKVLQRLKSKFEELPEELKLLNNHGKFSLQASPQLAIGLTKERLEDSSPKAEAQLILSRFQNTEFRRQDVMDSLNLTKSSALRLLKELQDQKVIIKMGQGPASYYQVAG